MPENDVPQSLAMILSILYRFRNITNFRLLMILDISHFTVSHADSVRMFRAGSNTLGAGLNDAKEDDDVVNGEGTRWDLIGHWR